VNLLDIVIIITVALLLATGFFTGVRRIGALLIATYFATIVAAASYTGLADVLLRYVGNISEATAHLAGFLLLLIVMGAIFYFVVSLSIKRVENRRGRLSILDNIGGAALAVVVGVLTIAMTLSVVVILAGAFNQTSIVGGVNNLGVLGDQIRESELVPIFIKLQPAINLALRPWFPNGLPAILDPPAA
jgi:hypothetical protein